MDSRLETDEYFIGIAFVASLRSTCLRRKVGAVIVRNNFVIATGYNGSPSGIKHCEPDNCLRKDVNSGEMLETCNAVHAEVNCIVQCARNGTSIGDGSYIYITDFPCLSCLKMIVNAGIKKIFYSRDYDMDNPIKKRILQESGLETRRVKEYKIIVTKA